MISFLTVKNIIIGFVVLTLAVAIPVTIRLSQQQTQLKSEATTVCEQRRIPNCSGSDLYCFCLGCRSQDNCRFQNFSNSGSDWSCVSSAQCAAGVFQYASNDCSQAINCSVPPPPPPSSTPTPQTVTIGGTLTRADGIPFPPGHDVNVLYDGRDHVEDTRDNGQFSHTLPQGKLYAVRPSDFTGYDKKTNSPGNCGQDSCGSYENQRAGGSPSCGSSCNFTYTPIRQSRCTSLSIKDSSNADVTGGPIYQNEAYSFNMTMTNLGATVWRKDTHKLKSVPGENTIDQIFTGLQDTYDMAEASVGKDGQAHFSTASHTVTANALPDGVNSQFKRLVYSMNDAQGLFGGYCDRSIQVNRRSTGGPGASSFTFNIDAVDDDVSISQGSSQSQRITLARTDVNPTDARLVGLQVSGLPINVRATFTGGGNSCSLGMCPAANPNCGATLNCQRTMTITADNNAPAGDSTITVTGTDVNNTGNTKPTTFILRVSQPTTPFNFTVSSPPNIILTKGQTDSGRNITVTKTEGNAEDVTLSVAGDIGGATFSFLPLTPPCRPENQCQRTLTFNTSQATPGVYVGLLTRGIATGGRSQTSLNLFTLTINPPAATVTCFVVSEKPEIRDGFLSCGQNVSSSDGIKGSFGDTLSVQRDFQLSANNGNKTLHARFLKLAQGESITTCTDNTKCKDTQAGITLNVVVGPSPTPTSPPVTGCGCQANNTCSSPCRFTKLTDIEYVDPVSCFTPARIHNITPTIENKNSYCNRSTRTLGDANGVGGVDIDDYLYYLTAVSGGKVPVSVNPDFDGNGDVGPNDLTIWERSINP